MTTLRSFRTRALTALCLFELAVAPRMLAQGLARSAPPEQQIFERFSVDDGLSQSDVFVIYQDRAGFLWLGTEDGLNRFDGYDFRFYQHEPFDSTSLANGPVTTLYEDAEGALWMGTGFGFLCKLDRVTDRFRRFRWSGAPPEASTNRVIKAITQDDSGTVWIGSWTGLARLDPAVGLIEHITTTAATDSTPPPGSVHDLLLDEDGLIWMTTDSGLSRLDPETGDFTHHSLDMGVGIVSQWDRLRGVGRLISDPGDSNVLWIGSGDGLIRFNTRSQKSRHFRTNPANGNLITGVAQDPDDPAFLWLGVYDHGLYRIEKNTGVSTSFVHDPRDRTSLSSNAVSSVFVDRTGMVWVGTFSAGLNRFEPGAGGILRYGSVPGDPTTLSDNEVFAVHEGNRGVLWVGTRNGGLNRVDRRTGSVRTWQHDPDDPTSLRAGWVSGILEDQAGNLWVATTDDGLSRMDPSTGRFTHLRHDPNDPESLGAGHVTTLYEDREGVVWIGTRLGGLNRMDHPSGRFTRFVHDPSDPGSIAGSAVTGITEDAAGRLWVSTAEGAGADAGDSGLCWMDRASGRFECVHHSEDDPSGLSSADVTHLHASRRNRGVLWIATTGGLNRLEIAERRFTHYTRADGLPGNHIKCIQEDDTGRLWLSTNNGLTHFDPELGVLRNYGVESGLQAAEFNPHACYQSDSGEMFFGGIGGLTAFHPDGIHANPHPPQVALTGIRFSGERPAAVPDPELTSALLSEGELRLPHNRNSLTFSFVGLHYRSPKKNLYAYRLADFDDEWVDAGNRREATYTNLEPGTYTFQVRAANSDGVWSDDLAQIQLVILPPWWRTWWAYMLYGVLAVGALVLIGRTERRRLIRKERERAAQRENELRTEAAEAKAHFLQIDNSRKTLELDQARELQMSMLPERVPEHPLAEVAAHIQTASEVGGDYYDFHVAEDGTLTVAIGDATGHGARAGTMVTAAKSLFISLAEEPDLTAILQNISRALRQMRLPRLYMTFALCRLRDGELELAGAGMPPALIVRHQTGCVDTLPLKGLPLGAPGDVPYEVTRVPIGPGDTVVLMSDGFPELRADTGQMIGYEGAERTLRELAGGSPEAVIDGFRERAAKWVNGSAQNDDMTFVVLRMKPRHQQQTG